MNYPPKFGNKTAVRDNWTYPLHKNIVMKCVKLWMGTLWLWFRFTKAGLWKKKELIQMYSRLLSKTIREVVICRLKHIISGSQTRVTRTRQEPIWYSSVPLCCTTWISSHAVCIFVIQRANRSVFYIQRDEQRSSTALHNVTWFLIAETFHYFVMCVTIVPTPLSF